MYIVKKHYEVVCAVIIKDDKILCCKRDGNGECAYKYEFPGGKIEPGETKEIALVREIKEELSCDIKIEKYLTTVEHVYNTFSVTLHVYICSLVSGMPVFNVHVDYVWCERNKLKNLDFAEADYKFLDMLINK